MDEGAAGSGRARTDSAFWRKKLFSFFGLVPLGVYVLWHLSNNLYALRGPQAFDARLAAVTRSPLYQPLIWLCVYLPFLFHSLVGLLVTWKASPNLGRMPTLRNWKYVLQRVSAIGVLLFVPAHVYKTKVEPWLNGYAIDHAHMREGMHEPITLVVYVLGMIGVAYHLANGVWLAGLTWGIFLGPGGQRRAEWLSIVLGIVVLVMAFAAIFSLRG